MNPRLKIESKLGRSLGSRFNRAAIRFLTNDQVVLQLAVLLNIYSGFVLRSFAPQVIAITRVYWRVGASDDLQNKVLHASCLGWKQSIARVSIQLVSDA